MLVILYKLILFVLKTNDVLIWSAGLTDDQVAKDEEAGLALKEAYEIVNEADIPNHFDKQYLISGSNAISRKDTNQPSYASVVNTFKKYASKKITYFI